MARLALARQEAAEIKAMEMLLEAEYISAGQYFMKRGPSFDSRSGTRGNRVDLYWDREGQEITAAEAGNRVYRRLHGQA